MNNDMLYNVNDKPPRGEWFMAAVQQLLAILTATILIPSICNVPIAPALMGAGIGTLIYMFFTKGQSPMFISSAGGFVSAVIGALALGTAPNFTAVLIGGAITMLIYVIVGLVVKSIGTDWLNNLLPPVVIGPVVTLIGLNLATYIPTYLQIGGSYSLVGVGIGFVTMIIAAFVSHYAKGFLRYIPFLIAIIAGYALSAVLTWCGIPVMNFNGFNRLFEMPDFAFFHIDFVNFDWKLLPQIIMLYAPISFVCIAEHIADHKALSSIIGIDLIKTPGLGNTLIGDGIASFFGSFICGLNNTSYGESVGTTGFSRIAYKGVVALAAVFACALSIIAPVQALFTSIPSCVFGGVSMILYGTIACSGIKVLANSGIDYNDNRNLTIIATIFTVGVGGIVLDLGFVSFGTTALALIVGVVLNAILRKR